MISCSDISRQFLRNQVSEKVDPILFEVIRNALVEATEEMSVSLQRTAYSTNIKTRLDYSCAFVDRRGRMVAQAFCQPAHLVTIGRLVPRAVAEYGAENLHPGDMLVVNDPHRQASHLNDIFLIAPFFHAGELLGYVTNTCHHVDVGGGAPASIGAFREIYQEGIILPVVKLVSREEIDPEIWKMVLANVRAAREVSGDLRAQIAANRMGMRRLAALVDHYGIEKLKLYMDRLLEYTEQRTRSELEKLPQGSYEAEGWLDDDGITDQPVHLKARATLDGETISFDFTGSDPAALGTHEQQFDSDLHGLCLRVEMPGGSGHSGQRRFLPADPGDCPERFGRELPASGSHRRRLGSLRPPLRDSVPSALPISAQCGTCRNQGHDVPGRFRG